MIAQTSTWAEASSATTISGFLQRLRDEGLDIADGFGTR